MMIERNITTLSNKKKTINFSLIIRSIHPGVTTLFSFFIVWLVAVLTTTYDSKAKDDGIATGQAAASAILAPRANVPFGEFPLERTGGWSLAATTQTTPPPAAPTWSIT